MKIFQASKTSEINSELRSEIPAKMGKNKNNKLSKSESYHAGKAELSESDIREKINLKKEKDAQEAKEVEISRSAKAQSQNQKLGEGFLNESMKPKFITPPPKTSVDVETEVSKDHLLKSDVGSNDPKDETTTEKLKTVLSKGAFSFNPKEREVLSRILGNEN
jgi:hypothetical protein